MKRILLLIVLSSIFCFEAFGQKCPMVRVILPSKGIFPGDSMLFSISLIGKFDNSKLEYKWTVSSGEISDGQGTTAILVETDKKTDGEVTATVEIKGLPEGCQDSFSETWEMIPIPIGEPLDKLGKMPWSNERVRLEVLVYELLQYPPQTKAYLIFSIANDSEKKLVLSRQRKILTFLEKNKILLSRILMKIEKVGYYQTTIWIVPEGAELPN